jgi:hypothetical protein
MPSSSSQEHRVSRRRALATLGTVVSGGLAGCASRVPGTGPEHVSVEQTLEDDRDPRLVWEFLPREDGRADGIGYAAVEASRTVEREARPPALRLEFNSTVGGIAADDPYEGYDLDWFRFRIWPPSTYENRLGYSVRVEPPGQWDNFSTQYDVRGPVRRTTVELRDANTRGTILVPAVFDPGGDALPKKLHCSFTVQASRGGLFGETIRATGDGPLPLDME